MPTSGSLFPISDKRAAEVPVHTVAIPPGGKKILSPLLPQNESFQCQYILLTL